MLNKILSIIQFLIIITFIFIINYYYFSDTNINKINKNRINLSLKISKSLDKLPLIANDTNNIIEYQNNNNKYEEKIKKRSFWNLLN
tara:strand:- start:1003 stop:1263 length:261 start_codon:yes stop_codon:yes gene_type:complete